MVWSATTELQTLSVTTELTVPDPLATKALGINELFANEEVDSELS